MPQEVQMPDNSVVEFPDEFTAEQIESHLKNFTQKPEDAPSWASQLPTTSTWAIQPPGEELRRKILSAPGQVMEQIATPASDMAADFLRRTGIDPSAASGKPTINIPSIPLIGTMNPALGYLAPEFTKGAEQKLGEFASSFTEPGQAPLLAVAPASKSIQALFAATAAAQIPESIEQIGQAKTPVEMGAAVAGTAADIGMAGLMGAGLLKGKYARQDTSPAALYGDVRSQQEPAKVVPAESGGPGVQPQAEAVAKTAQIPLTDEEQKQWYAERLEDPSLIDKAVKLSTGELAIPLGGNRTSGSSMSIHASPEEAELVAKELRGKPGFEGARVRGDVDENGNVVSHSVVWGRNAQELPTLTDRGRAYGYKESVLFREKVAQATQIPLSREELSSRDKARMTPEQRAIADIESQKYEEAERAAIAEAEKMGMKAKVVDIPPAEEGDENVPWAKGQYMKPTSEGVEINRTAFRGFVRNTLSRLPPEQQAETLRAVMDEEQRHLAIINSLGGLDESNEAMAQFWNDLTGLEKRLEFRSYTGVWTPEEMAKQWGKKAVPSDYNLGHEVVRRRSQKLATGTTSEIAQTVGVEKWTVKSINAMSDMIYNAREMLGTKASVRQRAVMDKILENLQVAKEVASGAAPAARERRTEEGIQAIRPAVRLINGDIKEGKKGEVHNDIMERHKLEGVDVDRRGFMGPQGWMDREQGPDSGREVPGMHATELAKMQESAPAAMERRREHFEKLPLNLRADLWQGTIIAGLAKPEHEHTGAYDEELIKMFATSPQSKWPIPNGTKDQLQQWFRDQSGGKYDRVGLIGQAIHSEVHRRMNDEADLLSSNRTVSYLDNLRKSVIASEHSTPEGYSPAARQRGKRQPYEPEQEKMFDVEKMTARGVPGSTETVQPVSATESGALPAIKLAALRPEDPPGAVDIAVNSERPSFHDFVSWVKRNVAGYSTAKEPQLRELWEDKVWGHLVTASGERIEQLLKSLQLESKLNPALRKVSGVRGVPQPRRIPDEFTAESDKQRRLQRAAAALLGEGRGGEQPDLVRIEQDRKQIELGKRLRRHAISEIGMKLLRESMPELGLDRKTIGLDDIDFENARAGAGAYHKFTEREATDPDYYTKSLEDRARPDKWSALTKTRRVAVLVNKQTGEVELVSAYKHGRQGIEIVDPTGATGVRGKEHFALSNYLGRYKLYASILLRDPVQFFHQHYDKLSEYSEEIDKIAEQREKAAELEDAGESVEERKFMSELFPGEEADLPEGMEPQEEGELPPVGEGVKGEGGIFMGPQAGVARGMMGIGKGFTRGRELMSSEANALREFVEGSVGKVRSKEDLTEAINRLKELGKLEQETRPKPEKPPEEAEPPTFPKKEYGVQTPIFTGQARKAVDAIRKAAHLIKLENIFKNRGLKPEEQIHLTDDQLYEKALDHFYEALTTTERPEDYTQAALRRFAGLVRQDLPDRGITVPGAAAGQAKGIARELTMRSRVPPTTLRDPTGKPIYGTQKPPELTPGRPGAPIPPELLPEASRATQGPGVGPPAELGTPIMEQSKPTGKGLYYPRLKPIKVEKGIPYYATEAAQPQPLPQELKQAWLDALGKGKAPGAFDRAKAQAAMKRGWDDFTDKLAGTKLSLKAITDRSFTMHDLFAYKQGARNIADNQARQVGEMVRLASFEGESKSKPARKRADLVDRSIAAVLAARVKDKEGNVSVSQNAFDNFLLPYVEAGRSKGLALMESSNPKERVYGRKVVDMAAKYKEEIEFARDHWHEPDMQAAVFAFEFGAERHREAMNTAGFQIAAKENWFPGRYEGELWMGNQITFGPNKILGQNFGRPKTFDNKYVAFANPASLFGRERKTPGGPPLHPYIAVNNRASDLLQHTVARGLHLANDQQWLEWLRGLKDPASGKPVAVKPKLVQGNVEGEDPDTGEIVVKKTLVPKPPGPDYVLVRATPNGPAMGIREDYRHAVEMVLAPSRISEMPLAREAHIVASMLKHDLLLMLDTFHIARLGQYSLALGAKDWGKSLGYKNGISALTWSEAEMGEAAQKGFITQKSVDWAKEAVPVFNANGTVKRYETRHARLQEALRRGLNSATNADTLYRDAIQNTPFVGELMSKGLAPVNKFIFDKMTPGMISESFIKNFERLHKANPKIPYNDLMRDVIRDTNVFYGNLGKQGWFKSSTYRDLASIVILAPLWREGLLRKEAMFYSRLTGLSALMGRKGYNPWPGSAYMGTLGRGVAAGLGTWFALAQVINLISKGHPTWQNEEDGHSLDAWIPTPFGKEGSGVWISTLGVFAELTHDLIRLTETKSKTWDAITQMGANAMGPIGRLAHILTSGASPTGAKYTTTGGVLWGATKELLPAPISLTAPLRLAGVGPALRPGEGLQRLIATATGTKSTLGTRPSQDIQRKATDWLRREGLKYEPMAFVPTDEASYAKLRGAVRNDDIKGARKVLEQLRAHKTDNEILHALKVFSRHPFTGTLKNERAWLYSMDNKTLDLYQKAVQEKFETYEACANLVLSQ